MYNEHSFIVFYCFVSVYSYIVVSFVYMSVYE